MNSNRIITLLEIVQQELDRQRSDMEKLRAEADAMRLDPQERDRVIGTLLAATDIANYNRRAAESALNRAIVALREEQDDA